MENQKDVLIGNITVLDPDKNQEYFCIVLDEKTENEYLRIRNNMQGQTTLYLIRELNFERDSFLSFNITCKEQVNVSTYSITKTFALNVIGKMI